MSAEVWRTRRTKPGAMLKLARTTERRLKSRRQVDWSHKQPVRNDMPRRLPRPSKGRRKALRGIDPRAVQVKRKKRQKRLRYCQRKELARS